MEDPVNEVDLQIIIDDDSPGAEERFKEYLKDYNKNWGWLWQGRKRENTPFSILIEDSGGLKDIDEIWIDSHGLMYLSRLLDNRQDMINLIYERTPRGIQGFRYAVQFLFLFNISRIHKIVERDAFGQVYEDEPNTIFSNINSANIIYNNYNELTDYDKYLINIMNEEVSLLIPDNMQDAKDVHPFDGRSVLDNQTGLFFKIFKLQFHLFMNRVSLKYYKTMRLHKLINAPIKKIRVNNISTIGRGGGDFTNSTIPFISSLDSKKSKKTDSISLKNILNTQTEYLNKVKIFKGYILQASINLPPDVKTLNSSIKKSSSKNKNTKLSYLIKQTPKNPKYGESMKYMSNGYRIINNSYTENGAEIGKDIILSKYILKILNSKKKGGLKK